MYRSALFAAALLITGISSHAQTTEISAPDSATASPQTSRPTPTPGFVDETEGMRLMTLDSANPDAEPVR